MTELPTWMKGYSNYVLLGEAGCGKSEIAIHLAMCLAREKKTELFDLDQTKPLFRSRDRQEQLSRNGVELRYERQFYDAPTAVGGVPESLRNREKYTVLDVGGDAAGASLIGGYAACLQASESLILYVINGFRPWSRTLENIDRTLSQIAKSARLYTLHYIANPNMGPQTTAAEVMAGLRRTECLLADHARLEAVCVREPLYEQVRGKTDIPVLPLELHMGYEWDT